MLTTVDESEVESDSVGDTGGRSENEDEKSKNDSENEDDKSKNDSDNEDEKSKNDSESEDDNDKNDSESEDEKSKNDSDNEDDNEKSKNDNENEDDNDKNDSENEGDNDKNDSDDSEGDNDKNDSESEDEKSKNDSDKNENNTHEDGTNDDDNNDNSDSLQHTPVRMSHLRSTDTGTSTMTFFSTTEKEESRSNDDVSGTLYLHSPIRLENNRRLESSNSSSNSTYSSSLPLIRTSKPFEDLQTLCILLLPLLTHVDLPASILLDLHVSTSQFFLLFYQLFYSLSPLSITSSQLEQFPKNFYISPRIFCFFSLL